MSTPRFEGSYLGADAKISEAAVMECKICWTPYDPAEGDETRQIPPGTPFLALPGDWKCPTCGAPREQLMVLSDAGVRAAPAQDAVLAARVAALEAEFREIHNAKMRNVPFSNKALHVEAVAFRAWNDQFLGVLVAPWFMNLILLPGAGGDWSDLTTGDKELIDLPSGTYEFIHTVRPGMGGYKGCSLFSPMSGFASQLQATDVARAVMVAVFDEKNRAETDSRVAIRTRREAELAAAAPSDATETPTRRSVITAGMGADPGSSGG